MAKVNGLVVGRIIHKAMKDGQCRPGIVVRVWNDDPATVNAQIFLDGTNDVGNFGDCCAAVGRTAPAMAWATSIQYDPERTRGVSGFHWPGDCDVTF